MKTGLLFVLLAITFFNFSCDKNKNNSSHTGYATTLLGNQVLESNNLSFTVENFTDNSTNQTNEVTKLIIQNTDGSYFEITFDGVVQGIYPLTSTKPNTASYFNTQFYEHISITGNISITEYLENDNQISITGVFAFQAQSIIDQALITVNDGVFSVTKQK